MLWDPFLMKKLIKNEICGSVNSAYMHCSLQKVTAKSTFAVTVHWTVTSKLQHAWKPKKKKKKKKEQNATQRELSWIQTHTYWVKSEWVTVTRGPVTRWKVDLRKDRKGWWKIGQKTFIWIVWLGKKKGKIIARF